MNSWGKAAEVLKKGGVIIIPSDSVYGIAALAKSDEAVKELYSIKKRQDTKPSLVIVSSIEQARKLIHFTPLAQDLASKYWPGGLTLVGESIDKSLSPIIYGDFKTLAVRFPNKPELVKLAQKAGPFIFPSANLSNQPPAYQFSEIDQSLLDSVDFSIDEKTDNNPVSTLVDIRGNAPVILRQGAIEVEI